MITAQPIASLPKDTSPSGRGVHDYLSPSRLNLWLRCPLAFRLRYMDGVNTPTTPSLFVGTVVHAVLEQYYRLRQLGAAWQSEDLSRRLNETWAAKAVAEEMTFESTADEATLKSQSLGLVQAYLDHVPSVEPPPLAVEASVKAPLIDPARGENFGIEMLGIMDLVLDEPSGPLICDFKTAARSTPPLETTHEIQLSSYAYLYRAATGRDEAGLEIRSLIKTKKPKVEFHGYARRTDQHFARLFAVIRAYLDDLDAGQFVFRPGMACTMCDYCQTHCRSWGG